MQTFDLFFVELSAEEMMALLQTVQFCGIIIPVIGMIAVLQKEQSKGSVYLIYPFYDGIPAYATVPLGVDWLADL